MNNESSNDTILTNSPENFELRNELNRLKNELKKERSTYMRLLDSIGEGVVVVDANNTITLINKVAESLCGSNQVDVLGKDCKDHIKLVHQDTTPLAEEFWRKALHSRTQSNPGTDISLVHNNGEHIPVVVLVSPILDKDQKESQGSIITIRDVREERILEEARVSFISTASHQLRTPLAPIRWLSEMLLGGDAGSINEDQRKFVERIYHGTDRMIGLVNLLLKMARVEAGRVRVDPIETNLKEFIEKVSLTLKPYFDQKNQNLTILEGNTTKASVYIDQDMLWQVLQNLLSNASRYGNENTKIIVSLSKDDEFVQISVKDSGIGIPKAQVSRVFEKFFRADNAISLSAEGSGLGLSFVKTLVDRWGGKIWFESKEGTGTTFYFTVPKTLHTSIHES